MSGTPAAFQADAFQNDAFQTGVLTPATHELTGSGGWYKRGERRKRGLAWDRRNLADDVETWLQAAFGDAKEEMDGLPEIAEPIIEVVQEFKSNDRIDWQALAADANALMQFIKAYDRLLQEMALEEDEDDVIALLLA